MSDGFSINLSDRDLENLARVYNDKLHQYEVISNVLDSSDDSESQICLLDICNEKLVWLRGLKSVFALLV
ncbi:hypothetical protein DWX94_14295 [Coprococcus eutactus]|uniref:Uncharacterized protein n=1 Tax=Coprococcus eutactus TaxID=33043 RepID=A0A412IDU7_9FIRM|nr:hypothetical protein DWX94_14295 [Coprococcus eutactus]